MPTPTIAVNSGQAGSDQRPERDHQYHRGDCDADDLGGAGPRRCLDGIPADFDRQPGGPAVHSGVAQCRPRGIAHVTRGHPVGDLGIADSASAIDPAAVNGSTTLATCGAAFNSATTSSTAALLTASVSFCPDGAAEHHPPGRAAGRRLRKLLPQLIERLLRLGARMVNPSEVGPDRVAAPTPAAASNAKPQTRRSDLVAGTRTGRAGKGTWP